MSVEDLAKHRYKITLLHVDKIEEDGTRSRFYRNSVWDNQTYADLVNLEALLSMSNLEETLIGAGADYAAAAGFDMSHLKDILESLKKE